MWRVRIFSYYLLLLLLLLVIIYLGWKGPKKSCQNGQSKHASTYHMERQKIER